MAVWPYRRVRVQPKLDDIAQIDQLTLPGMQPGVVGNRPRQFLTKPPPKRQQ